MDTFEASYQRRAVKHYDPQYELTDDEIQKLMEAAVQKPNVVQHSELAIRVGP